MSDRRVKTQRAKHARSLRLARLSWGIGGRIGLYVLVVIAAACLLSLPWTMGSVAEPGTGGRGVSPRYDLQNRAALRLPPSSLVGWFGPEYEADYTSAARDAALRAEADRRGGGMDVQALQSTGYEPSAAEIAAHRPGFVWGTDQLGRSVLVRCLVGGAISLVIGLAAAALSVFIGTMYGAFAGYAGGRIDGVMMRVVDVLYGLPYVLLVVLLAVAVDGGLGRWQEARIKQVGADVAAYVERETALLPVSQQSDPGLRERLLGQARAQFGTGELSDTQTQVINMVTLLVAIGGVSWLTMARVIRGQVLSLKAQPYMEAARAIGVPVTRQFSRHLLPNLVGPIVVYATLTVPQAILQESFLSFLGIGVKPPLPSWGNLAADALGELNTAKSHWWMLVFPCVLLGVTLLALNFVGEALREALDPKSQARGQREAMGEEIADAA